MAEPLLAVDGLTVGYGKREVLKGLDFEVQPGEIFGLLGPNGSGKSTTFSVLTGLLKAEAGRIRFNGQTVEPGARSLRAELGVDATHVAMVGDDVENDVLAAQDVGLHGVLVRTGKHRPEAVAAAEGTPEATIDSVADLPGLLGI